MHDDRTNIPWYAHNAISTKSYVCRLMVHPPNIRFQCNDDTCFGTFWLNLTSVAQRHCQSLQDKWLVPVEFTFVLFAQLYC